MIALVSMKSIWRTWFMLNGNESQQKQNSVNSVDPWFLEHTTCVIHSVVDIPSSNIVSFALRSNVGLCKFLVAFMLKIAFMKCHLSPISLFQVMMILDGMFYIIDMMHSQLLIAWEMPKAILLSYEIMALSCRK